MSAKIRPARVEDAATIVALIRELATYEKLEQQAQARVADIERHLFGPHPAAGAFITSGTRPGRVDPPRRRPGRRAPGWVTVVRWLRSAPTKVR